MTQQTPSPDDYMLIGEVVAPFGIRGQLKLRSLTDNVDYVRKRIKLVYLGPKRQEFHLKELFEHKPGVLVMTLDGVTTRDQAEDLRGSEVAILEHQASPLAKDEYFIHQLYGLDVQTEDGSAFGKVREIVQTGANDVLVVAREGQSDALIPVIHDVIVAFDFEKNTVVIRLLEGLLGD